MSLFEKIFCFQGPYCEGKSCGKAALECARGARYERTLRPCPLALKAPCAPRLKLWPARHRPACGFTAGRSSRRFSTPAVNPQAGLWRAGQGGFAAHFCRKLDGNPHFGSLTGKCVNYPAPMSVMNPQTLFFGLYLLGFLAHTPFRTGSSMLKPRMCLRNAESSFQPQKCTKIQKNQQIRDFGAIYLCFFVAQQSFALPGGNHEVFDVGGRL